MINIINRSIEIKKTFRKYTLFDRLRNKYTDEQLFLLESLCGPKRDVKQTIIGFSPFFHIEFYHNRFQISGHNRIKQEIKNILLKDFIFLKVIDYNFYMNVPDNIWNILRRIETAFNVDYEGDVISNISFGYFGYFGYDTIHFIDNIPLAIKHSNMPIISLNIYQGMFITNLTHCTTYLIINNSPCLKKITHEEILNKISNISTLDKVAASSQRTLWIKDSVRKKQYFNWVSKAFEHLNKGDIYQIQLGHEIKICSTVKPYEVYKRLRTLNPSPYMYYTKLGSHYIIGASPELFLRIDSKHNVTMRPIAGTIKKGNNKTETLELQNKLLHDKKERAEHIMLVDLCRNDIGIICKKNSLHVNELMNIEEYSHVSHLVSNVVGIRNKIYDKYDVIKATFPAGTISGAPKIRSMEIIETMETTKRNIYGGAIGFLDFRGVVETALCIRMAVYRNGIYTIRASGGIVYDSTSEGEWKETINKLSSTYYAITQQELCNEDFIN